MPGLDYIPRYQTGGDVDKTDTTDTTTPPPAVAKPVASKSPYGLPTPTGKVGVDESILERMQEMIAEREKQKGGFMESLRDAQAWWSGGMAGPGEALARRAKEREEFDATTFGMRRDLAQYRVAQERAKNLATMIGGGAPAAGGAAPAAEGAAPVAGGVAPATGSQLINLVRDPSTKSIVMAQLNQNEPDEAFKTIQTYVAKNAEDPQLVKEIRAGLAQGWLTPEMVQQLYPVRFAGGAETFKPFDVRGPGGTTQSTAIQAAQAAFPRTTPAAPAGRAPAAAPMPAAAPAAPVSAPAPAAAAPAARPSGAAAGPQPIAPVQPLPRVGTQAAPAPEAPVPTETPLVPTNVQTGFTPGSKEDLEAKAAIAKQNIETTAETQKPVAQELGQSIVSTKRAASSAPDSIREYDIAESLLKKYPRAVGIAQDGSATAALIQLVKPGATIPILGSLKVEGAEEFVAQSRLTPKELEARNTFQSLAKRKSVDFAQNNLTGEGRGTLSNADLLMSDVAKGLSKDSPAATNLIYTILNRENDQMMLERGRLIEKTEREARQRGVQPNYAALRESDAWKKTMSDKDARIRSRFPELFDSPEGKKRYEEIEKSRSGGGGQGPAVKKYNPQTRKVE